MGRTLGYKFLWLWDGYGTLDYKFLSFFQTIVFAPGHPEHLSLICVAYKSGIIIEKVFKLII